MKYIKFPRAIQCEEMRKEKITNRDKKAEVSKNTTSIIEGEEKARDCG